MLDNEQLWGQTLREIELGVSRANFSTWFKNTQIVKQESGIIYLGVPSAFVKDWLCNKFHAFILRSLRGITSEIRALEYLVVPTETFHRQTAEKQPPAPAPQLNLQGLYTNREDGLNPKYTFSDFVVGSFNELAYAAAQAVIKKIGLSYNPLFVYGGTGLGKTHLIQAIGNAVKKNQVDKKVLYLTSEQYAVDYVCSVQNRQAHLFKEKYRCYDVLVMDDVQFFSDKNKTQEELFHLFNHFSENNKQIVFSSDKSPQYIPNIEERLRSRFEGGMIVDVIRPDYESRLAILRSKLKGNHLAPPEEVVEYVASTIQDNIRELEGALNLILCQAQLKNHCLNLGETKQLLKNHVKPQKTVSVHDITVAVADFYNVGEKMLYDKTRKKEVVKPRQVAMYLLREDFNSSFPYIGQKLGGRDHTTVIHAYDKIRRDLKENNVLSQEIEQIRSILYNR